MSPRLNECFASQNGLSAMIELGGLGLSGHQFQPVGTPKTPHRIEMARNGLGGRGPNIFSATQSKSQIFCISGFCFEHLEQSRGPGMIRSCGILWNYIFDKYMMSRFLFGAHVCVRGYSPGRTRYFFKCLDITRTMRELLSAMKQQLKLNLLVGPLGCRYPPKH